jgi:hypothetical protein
MALSSVRIADTINWAKRFSFDRNPVIGNSLEPALTSAQMVMQTVLGPPFSWFWNNEELSFTCNPTPASATITNIAIAASGVLTVTANNTFFYGNPVLLKGLTTATNLNGQLVVVQTYSPTSFTAQTNFATYASAADTGTASVTTTQDYTLAAPEFSHIEHCSVLDINPATPIWMEMEVKNNLSLDSKTDRPRFLNPHTEDGNGNMTFRVMPAPDAAYPVSIHVQKAAPRITSINQTWAPIPDFMQYVVNWGFLALIWAFADDPRFQVANQKFLAGLLARAEGISEEDRNVFLNNWNNLTSGQNMDMQQGKQARGQ